VHWAGRESNLRKEKLRKMLSSKGISPQTYSQEWEPTVVVFCCHWCAYAGADLAGMSRIPMNPRFRIIRVMCSGRVDPELVLQTYRSGADGVMIGGCHPGDCHYVSGNHKAMRRVMLLQMLLSELGMNPERLVLEWISASEGNRFARRINEFVERITLLGPLKLDQGIPPGDTNGE